MQHYSVKKLPEKFDPALEDLVTSPHAKSCTSFVTSVEVPYCDGEELQLCVDTPGIEENRSEEQGIAG